VSNVNIYGFEESVKRHPSIPWRRICPKSTAMSHRAHRRSWPPAQTGSGHDNFLNGVIVQFDLTFTNKAWVEAERYHFLDFVSSQSTMHRITKFDLDQGLYQLT
jgi:hypothetical protein